MSRKLFTLVASVLVFLVANPSSAVYYKIKHKPLDEVTTGQRAEITLNLEEEQKPKSGIKEVRVYFKPKDSERYYYVPAQQQADEGEEYIGVLPAMALGAGSFSYFALVIGNNKELTKTETFTVSVKDDEAAIARMQQKAPTDVKVDVEQVEQAKKTVEESRQVTDADRAKVTDRGGKADADSRVEVRSEFANVPTEIPGVFDYVNVTVVDPSKAMLAAAESAQVTAVSSGLGGAAVGGIAVAAGVGVAAAAGGGGGNGGSPSGTSGGGGATGSVCSNASAAGSDAPQSIVVDLGRTSGTFGFSWQMFTQKDRMVVTTSTLTPLFDTGCVSGTGSVNVPYNDAAGQIRVNVLPNCAGGTGTQWNFQVLCP